MLIPPQRRLCSHPCVGLINGLSAGLWNSRSDFFMELGGRSGHKPRNKVLHFGSDPDKGVDPGLFLLPLSLTLQDTGFYLNIFTFFQVIIHICSWNKSDIFKELISMSVCNVVRHDLIWGGWWALGTAQHFLRAERPGADNKKQCSTRFIF